MSKPEPWVNPYEKIVEQAFDNPYKLLMEEVTYDDLGLHFVLPENHEDPQVTLEYYIQVENYDRCAKIRDKIKENE